MAYNVISENMLTEESEFLDILRLAAIDEITCQNLVRACPEMVKGSG
jgi:hypothetical protein